MRSSIVTLASAALLAATQSSAFKHTSPLLIWSSEPNEALRGASAEVVSGVIAAEEVYSTMSTLGCGWESLVVVNVDELHHSHLAARSLPYSTKADLHLPYLLRPSRPTLESAVSDWAKVCGAEVVSGLDSQEEGKKVVLLDMKSDADLSSLTLPSHPHLLVLTGTHSASTQAKRQERPFPSHSSSSAASSTSTSSRASSTSSHKSTIPTDGPLLDRIQILTTPVIAGLIITFFVFFPIIMFGVSSLAGIQVPPRMMEISKGLVVSKERKDR